MNKEIYKQNITALRNKYPAWANIIKNRHKKKNIDVIVEKKRYLRYYIKGKEKW